MKAANPIVPILVYLSIALLGNAKADSIDCVARKDALLAQLDSIDMEKQMRKRKGLSLEELEKKSLFIKDSIAAVKMNIHRENGKPAALPVQDRPPHHVFNVNRFFPHNAFDWVVLVFAAIALIAGAILCIGLFSMVWKTITIKKKPSLKTMQETLSLRDERVIHENASRTAESYAGINESTIDSLKKRINIESKSFPDPSPAPSIGAGAVNSVQGSVMTPPEDKAAPQTSISPSSSTDDAPAADLKTKIIKAASQGADVAQISRQFHVSADQVSLILRVSHQENGKKP